MQRSWAVWEVTYQKTVAKMDQPPDRILINFDLISAIILWMVGELIFNFYLDFHALYIERYVNEGVATFYSCHMASKWLLLGLRTLRSTRLLTKKKEKRSTRLI